MTSATISQQDKNEAINIFSQKLINSGHTIKAAREIIVSGLKGFKRRVTRCKDMGLPLHRSAGQSAQSRRTKKLLARSSWFRKEQDDDDTYDVEKEYRSSVSPPLCHGGRGKNPSEEKQAGAKLQTSTVLFVEFSKGEVCRRA